MNMTDVKILWGRAANRCSFPNCRIELSPVGDKKTLGEMAHIIARSPDGPRGQYDIRPESKDSYENLVLLCPTHHSVIDKDPKEWSVEKVKQMKAEHEKWVTALLDVGSISIASIDNSGFVELRKKDWLDFAREYIWVVLSLTPLNIAEDTIDPLNATLLGTLNSLTLPEHVSDHTSVNKYHTRPNEHGVINEDLRSIGEGYGHRVQIFRNGHCEFLICLEGMTQQVTDIYRDRVGSEYAGIKVILYSSLTECVKSQIKALHNIWHSGIPFNDMLLTALMTNTRSTCLDSEREHHGYKPLLGAIVSSNILEHGNVIDVHTDSDQLLECVVKRLVNYYGLVIDALFDDNGKMLRPKRLFG